MHIEKIKENPKQELEKIYITKPSVIFVLSDKLHKPLVRVFQGI